MRERESSNRVTIHTSDPLTSYKERRQLEFEHSCELSYLPQLIPTSLQFWIALRLELRALT